ncbi:MAG: YkgJ family cysteine cluster protein [Synergistaceae bacterium]|nr:YkgJ family cysteine cluster protein [Synergistaceae bacterium]
MWWKEGLRFSCIACGRCCRGEPGAIYFTPEEEQALASRFNLSLQEFRDRYTTSRWEAPSIREKRWGDCIFHDEKTNLCLVYEDRPMQCRLFPFWPSLLRTRKAWNRAAQYCPGMNDGELYDEERIAALLDACPFPDLL